MITWMVATAFGIQRDGQRADALVTLEGGRLSASFTAATGGRTVAFWLDGGVLVVDSALHRDKLNGPLRWTTRYRRDEVQ